MLLDLFPLNSVLFPYQKISLRIFEPRYLKLIEACHMDKRSFGICMIKEGKEVGAPAIPFKIGTSVAIKKLAKVSNNFIHIVIQGERRFRIEKFKQEQPHIIVEMEWLDNDIQSFPGDYSTLRNLVSGVLKDKYEAPEDNNELFGIVGKLMAFNPKEKQEILELPHEEVVPALIKFLQSI